MNFKGQAMVLAAGRGERMRPLTDRCPKPLLQVRGQPLLQYHLEALARAGFARVVVNTAWLGEQITQAFGDPPRLAGAQGAPLQIAWSHEGIDFGDALETAGGGARGLPQLDEGCWVAARDVRPDRQGRRQVDPQRFAAGTALAHLWLVPNPPHNPRGDFALSADGHALNDGPQRYTYSTVGLYRRALFDGLPMGNPQGLKAPLAPLLREAIDNGRITAEIHTGPWTDVGTPERLAQLNAS